MGRRLSSFGFLSSLGHGVNDLYFFALPMVLPLLLKEYALSYRLAGLVLVGTGAMEQTFGSTCHGAGRVMSRHAAIRAAKGRAIHRELEDQGIIVKASGRESLAEEMPEAYKDVTQVVMVVHRAGLSKMVARLRPMGVIKG